VEGQGASGAEQVGDRGRLDERHAAEGGGGRPDHALDGPFGRVHTFAKLNVRSRSELAAEAIKRGLG
jgi:hypothetical protein